MQGYLGFRAAQLSLRSRKIPGSLVRVAHHRRPRGQGEARRRGVRASSTVGVVAQLLTIDGNGIDTTLADMYLETLQSEQRMYVQLKSAHLTALPASPEHRKRSFGAHLTLLPVP